MTHEELKAAKLQYLQNSHFSMDLVDDIKIIYQDDNYSVELLVEFIKWGHGRLAEGKSATLKEWNSIIAPEMTGAPSPRHTNKKED